MRRFVILLLAAGYVLLSSQLISFRTTATDLGRHLRDGELILNGQAAPIFHRNYYSFTHPEFPFLNHHWLMSVIFYLTSKDFGLAGLNVLYTAMGAATFFLYWRLAEQEIGFAAGASLSAALLPLMAVRAGVRPEVFSMLLLAVFLTILWGCREGSIRPFWLWCLPVLEVLWVNLHPGFILGPILVATFLITQLAFQRLAILSRRSPLPVASGKRVKRAAPAPADPPRALDARPLAIVLGLTLAAGAANPNGVRGLLFPLTVAGNYSMPVRENLSVFQLQDRWPTIMVELAVAVLFGALVWAYRRGLKIDWPVAVFAGATALMSVAFYRIYVFLGGFVLLTLCTLLRSARARGKSGPQGSSGWIWVLAAAAAINVVFITASHWQDTGFAVAPHDEDLAAFLHDNGIHGRVFNAYGSGGYLIHYLPGQPVYVDSRPEAYPGSFIRDDYLLPLEDENAWHRVMGAYDFDFICFTQFDQENGNFLLRRIQDPGWALVFSGAQAVLVRRKAPFLDVIASHEVRFK